MASFIEPPQTTDPLELLRHFQREAERRETPKTELPKGILERPSEEVDDKSYGVMKFFADWWSGTENKVAEARKEVLEGLVNMPMPTLPTPTSEALDATLPGRESEPVIEGVAPDKPSMLKPEVLELEVDTRSNEALDKSNQTMSKAIEDVLETVVDSDVSDSTDSADGGAAPSDGKGIMSPTEGDTVDVDASTSEVTTTLPVYSTTTNAVYTDFYENNEEGDEAHIGQDSKNLTLAAGIVADGGVTYNGKEVKAGKNTVKASAFDSSKVDMSKAYKKVGGKNYKREDYTSDEDWSKAVIEAFKDVVKGRAGDSWDELTDNTKQAVTKLAWNNGEGWANYDTSQSLYKELAKETKDKTIIADGILNYSTVVDGGASIGVAKARANAWNKMSDAHGFTEINKITADNTGTKTKFNYYDKEGNLVHTETTNRAPSNYSSTATEVEKDTAGEW